MLENAGIECLFDDRDISPGMKFNDADLIGIPYQLIVGEKGLNQHQLELKIRSNGERILIPITNEHGGLQNILVTIQKQIIHSTIQ
jgi:prolyl-tRNA synthetase